MTSLAPATDTAVRTRWPQRGAAWAEALPAELDTFCAGLGVTPRRAYPAHYAFVVHATSPSGAALVIRSSADPDAEHQAAVLRHLSDVGLAPRLHAVETTPTTVWTISDAVEPGTPNGEPAYDVAVVALKACHDDPTHARPAAAALATAANLDPGRAASWTSIAAMAARRRS